MQLKHHFLQGYGILEVLLCALLTLALNRGMWSAARLSCFAPRERAASTCWIRGWVGPRPGVNTLKKTVSCLLKTDDTLLSEMPWILQNRNGKFKKLKSCSHWQLWQDKHSICVHIIVVTRDIVLICRPVILTGSMLTLMYSSTVPCLKCVLPLATSGEQPSSSSDKSWVDQIFQTGERTGQSKSTVFRWHTPATEPHCEDTRWTTGYD